MAQTSKHVSQHLTITQWKHDPDSASATVTTPDAGTTERWVDMALYEHFGVTALLTIIGSSSGITLLEIVAASDTDGTAIAQIVTSGAFDADALGDWAFVECNAEQVRAKAVANSTVLRYVAARITCSNSGDEATVTYIGMNPKWAKSGLTAATTIA